MRSSQRLCTLSGTYWCSLNIAVINYIGNLTLLVCYYLIDYVQFAISLFRNKGNRRKLEKGSQAIRIGHDLETLMK